MLEAVRYSLVQACKSREFQDPLLLDPDEDARHTLYITRSGPFQRWSRRLLFLGLLCVVGVFLAHLGDTLRSVVLSSVAVVSFFVSAILLWVLPLVVQETPTEIKRWVMNHLTYHIMLYAASLMGLGFFYRVT